LSLIGSIRAKFSFVFLLVVAGLLALTQSFSGSIAGGQSDTTFLLVGAWRSR
jgi:hypothetical protein